MLTGRSPFERDGDTHRVRADEPHRRRAAPAVARGRPEHLPAAFERIIGRALAKKPQDRYTRASEMADELRKAAREATGVGQAYEKTLKVDTAFDKTVKVDAHQKTVKVDTLQSQLLDDLDTFVKRIDEEQLAMLRAAEAERLKKEQERVRRAEEAKRAQTERAARPSPAAAGARPPSALEALRKQAEVRPRREDPAAARPPANDVLDAELRAAYDYLARFAGEVNSVAPHTSLPYDVLYIGRVPVVSLSNAWIDTRPRRIGGREYCDHIYLRYRVNPEPPARVTLIGPDIVRCEQHLKSLGAEYQLDGRVAHRFRRAATRHLHGEGQAAVRGRPAGGLRRPDGHH